MKRVLVVGSPGSGKSVFSIRLGEVTGLPVIHLDKYYWRSGWVEPPRDVWDTQLDELLRHESWIIDGNYSRTMDFRLDHCDTAIFLDFPRWLCSWRVAKRFIQYRGRSRPDLAAGCPEKFDLEFVRWTWTYPERSRVKVVERLKRRAGEIAVVKLKSKGDVENFILSQKSIRTHRNGN